MQTLEEKGGGEDPLLAMILGTAGGKKIPGIADRGEGAMSI